MEAFGGTICLTISSKGPVCVEKENVGCTLRSVLLVSHSPLLSLSALCVCMWKCDWYIKLYGITGDKLDDVIVRLLR